MNKRDQEIAEFITDELIDSTEVNKCHLVLPNQKECGGLITDRCLEKNMYIKSCESHYIAFKQIHYLAQCGVDIKLVSEMTQANRILAIGSMEDVNKN